MHTSIHSSHSLPKKTTLYLEVLQHDEWYTFRGTALSLSLSISASLHLLTVELFQPADSTPGRGSIGATEPDFFA